MEDANNNSIPDNCEIDCSILGVCPDCNSNSQLDSEDITNGFSEDLNLDGVLV